jgi:hypothetical protein
MTDITPTPGAPMVTAIRVPLVIAHKGGPASATFSIVAVSALAKKTQIIPIKRRSKAIPRSLSRENAVVVRLLRRCREQKYAKTII